MTKGQQERLTVLQEALRIIHGERRDNYGEAEQSFQQIADMWYPIIEAWFTQEKITGSEAVALCMMQLKIARYMNGQDRDSVVDIAGYAGCLGQIKDF